MILVLLASVLFQSPAQASVNAALVTSTARLIDGAEEDVTFLDQHVAGCTRFASTIQSQLVAPIARDLTQFRARLARYTNVPPRSCGSRADLDFIIGTISQKLALASSPQSQLMGMTGDEAMIRALSAGDGYPDCRAEDPRDPKTTRQLKAYFGLKLKLAALKASVISLKADTDCEKRE